MLMKKEQNTMLSADVISFENIELVHSGEDFFNRLQSIISFAKSEIHLQTYILENDATGLKVADALKEAVSRGVQVYVLLDGYGSSSLPENFTKELVLMEIDFRFFSPFFSMNSIYIGRRLHHKIVVADGNIALIGGINIADKYRGTNNNEPWLDYAVQLKGGPITEHLQQLCKKIYLKKNRESIKKTKNTFEISGLGSASILQNDWLHTKNEIYNAYSKAIQNAKEEIIILGSYFFPGRGLTKSLLHASRRGVKVKLILSGVSDVPLARRATGYLYTQFLQNNIELYEWKSSVLHGKVATVDNQWATVGSFNLNHLSSYGSIELNLEINSKEFSRTLVSSLDDVIAKCEKITDETLRTRGGRLTLILNWMAYRTIRMLFEIATYVPYKRFFKRYQDE